MLTRNPRRRETASPTCDLHRVHCTTDELSDAYQAELHLGNILGYLKCCKIDPYGGIPQPRYPKLKQVFVTSRIYGGYANGSVGGANACLNPEPFAYELAFGVQRLIVAQINQTPDEYSGSVNYKSDGTGNAPWVDWGPYLWASRDTPRNLDGLYWCGGQDGLPCNRTFDVIQGDVDHPELLEFGDFAHPNGNGVQKVAGKLLEFIDKTSGSEWIKPWIIK